MISLLCENSDHYSGSCRPQVSQSISDSERRAGRTKVEYCAEQNENSTVKCTGVNTVQPYDYAYVVVEKSTAQLQRVCFCSLVGYNKAAANRVNAARIIRSWSGASGAVLSE